MVLEVKKTIPRWKFRWRNHGHVGEESRPSSWTVGEGEGIITITSSSSIIIIIIATSSSSSHHHHPSPSSSPWWWWTFGEENIITQSSSWWAFDDDEAKEKCSFEGQNIINLVCLMGLKKLIKTTMPLWENKKAKQKYAIYLYFASIRNRAEDKRISGWMDGLSFLMLTLDSMAFSSSSFFFCLIPSSSSSIYLLLNEM